MFQFSYIPFLSVSFLHGFYADSISRDFDFSPLPDTQLLMESFGFKYKNLDGRLSIFQQLDKDNLPFQQLDTVLDLFFVVNVKTDILNITERFGQGKYFFSNLKKDGTYSTQLTQTGSLGIADELPEISGQQKVVNFTPGTINSIVLKHLVAGIGWTTSKNFPIDAKANSIELNVNKPGLYQIEKNLKAGGKEQTILLMSDELLKLGNIWSVIHLQIKPGDQNLLMNITLTPQKALWQFFLVEMKGRIGGPIVPGSLEVTYKAEPPSRYSSAINLQLKDPNTYPDPVKNYVINILTNSNIKAVYLFEASDKLEFLEGQQPQVKIRYTNKEIAGKVTIPSRSMNKATIIYKL